MTTGKRQQRRVGAAADGSREAETLMIAHRGFAGIFPENTVAAVASSAADERTGAIEIDVMPTRDGQVIVFHDDDLSRVTHAPASIQHEKIWELSYEQIAGYSVLGTTQSVPLLSDVLAAVPSTIPINIELKNPGCADVAFAEPLDERERERATDRWREFVGDVLDVTADYDHELLVSSFCEGALAATRELAPSVALASVFWDSVETGLTITERYDTESLHLPWNMIAGTPFFNDAAPAPGPFPDVDLVEAAHDAGRTVNAWTVKTWRQAVALREAGVDGVIADYPGVFSEPVEIDPSVETSASVE